MSLRCPYCHAELSASPQVRCRECATPVHAECAELHGRCVVLACRGDAFDWLERPPTATTLRYQDPLGRRARRAANLAGAILAAPAQGVAPVLLAAAGLAALGWICATAP